jgi:hypothetical protein
MSAIPTKLAHASQSQLRIDLRLRCVCESSHAHRSHQWRIWKSVNRGNFFPTDTKRPRRKFRPPFLLLSPIYSQSSQSSSFLYIFVLLFPPPSHRTDGGGVGRALIHDLPAVYLHRQRKNIFSRSEGRWPERPSPKYATGSHN